MGALNSENLLSEMGEMPAVTETVASLSENPVNPVNPVRGPDEIPVIDAEGKVDVQGRSFDRDLHSVDEKSGRVILNSKGKLKMRRRGRPTGSAPKSTASVLHTPHTPDAVVPDASSVMDSRALGVHSAALLVTVGKMLGGDEWIPRKSEGYDELGNLEHAFGDYFVAREMHDIPPGVALTIAILGYAAPRFVLPTTKKRTLSFGQKIKLWWFAKRITREQQKPPKRVEKIEAEPEAQKEK